MGAPAFFELNQACVIIKEALDASFDSFGVYLVGSALYKRDHRDVDVRAILPDDKYAQMFPAGGGWTDAYWSVLCTSISFWLSKQTGLNIDFQVQQQTQANHDYPSPQHKRSALGLFTRRARVEG